MALPAADTKTFQEIIFPELQREEAQALIHQYNKVGKLAAYKQELYLWLIERETNFVFPVVLRNQSRLLAGFFCYSRSELFEFKKSSFLTISRKVVDILSYNWTIWAHIYIPNFDFFP